MRLREGRLRATTEAMPNISPTIELHVGGDAVQVDVDIFSGPEGGEQTIDTAAVLTNNSGTIPGLYSVAPHPTDPRAVILTPAATGNGGSVPWDLGSSPPATTGLRLDIRVTVPPITREIQFKSVGPVQE